jgi:tetratricopeptide (TPR) repeat protein
MSGITRTQVALERSTQLEPSPSQFALYDVLATMLSYSGKHGQALEAVERAVGLARDMRDDGLLARALASRGIILSYLGRSGEALEALDDVIPLAEEARDLESLGRALKHAAQVCGRTGPADKARRYAERYCEVAKQLGSPATISESRNMAGWAAYLLGDWDQARAHWEEGASTLRQIEKVEGAMLAGLRWQQGEGDDARRDLENYAALADRRGDILLLAEAHYWLAEADLVAGDMEAVVARLEPLLGRVVAGPEGQQKMILLQSLAQAYLELGRETEAQHMVAEVLSTARAKENRHGLVEALVVQGLVLAHQRKWEEAERVFEKSLSHARSLPYPFGEAQTLYACGRMHAEGGEPERARERFEEALVIFGRLGARPYARRTDQALARLPNDRFQPSR